MRGLIAALALIAGTATVAGAHPEAFHAAESVADRDAVDLPLSRFGIGIFFQDVVALTPGTGAFIAPVGGAVIGVAGVFQHRFSPEGGWYLDVGAGYGVGHETIRVLLPVAFKDETSFKALYARAGLGYEVRIHQKVSGHAGGGLFFSRTRATFHNGPSTTDGEKLDVFGIDHALGGRVGMGGTVDLYCEHFGSYGWGAGKGPEAEYSATVKQGGYRGGLMFGF